jgi:putative acetyltransferase
VKVRPLLPGDTQAVADLFAETVRVVNAADYTAEQVSAWTSQLPDLSSWRERLAGEAGVFVAEAAKRIVGFAAVTRDNHLDLLYTHARFVRQGVATALFQRVEEDARSRGVDRLFADVSVTARPFFQRAGFRLITAQTVERGGVEFLNYRMEKLL